jgi:tRNA-dihydrouridine synthase
MIPSQDIFHKNPDLYRFCVEGGIIEQIVLWLDENTKESKKKVADLILETKFSDNLANEIYKKSKRTLIIGNGDVNNKEEGIQKAEVSGVDGIMVGRGIFKNPWAFLPSEIAQKLNTKENRLEMLFEHLTKWKETWVYQKHFPAMKKFVKMYINDFPNAKEFRMELMDMNSAEEMLERISLEMVGQPF